MNAIKIFENAQFGQIRTVMSDNNEPMFCLADVCNALGLNGGARNVKSRLNEKGVVSINTPTNGGIQALNFINEPNLYKCIFQSRKAEAEIFQDWVTSEVLPTIRKTGGYIATKADDTPEEIMARALAIAQDTLSKREQRIAQLQATNEDQALRIEQQEEQLKASAPKVKFYEEHLQSNDTLTTTQVAKEIGLDANKLNQRLKAIGIIYKQSGQWLLKQPFCQWGLHATRTQTFTRSDGTTGTNYYSVWKQKGKMFIIALSECGWNINRAIAHIKGQA